MHAQGFWNRADYPWTPKNLRKFAFLWPWLHWKINLSLLKSIIPLFPGLHLSFRGFQREGAISCSQCHLSSREPFQLAVGDQSIVYSWGIPSPSHLALSPCRNTPSALIANYWHEKIFLKLTRSRMFQFAFLVDPESQSLKLENHLPKIPGWAKCYRIKEGALMKLTVE